MCKTLSFFNLQFFIYNTVSGKLGVNQTGVNSIREMLKLLRRANANINQIAKHLHETGRVYDTDLEEILGYQKEIYKGQNELLTRLVKLQ